MRVIDLDHFTPEKRKKLTKKEKLIILKAYGYHCANKKCTFIEKGITAILDITDAKFHHRTPLSIGGTNELYNFAPLCEECHKVTTSIQADKHYSPDSIIHTFVRLKMIPTCLLKGKVTKRQKKKPEQLGLF